MTYRNGIDSYAYEPPDPARAYRLMLSHGINAVRERWPHLSEQAVGKVLQRGKRLATGADGKRNRSPEELARIVDAAFRLGSLADAGRELGIRESAVRSALESAGHREYPRLPAAERGRRAHATKIARKEAQP